MNIKNIYLNKKRPVKKNYWKYFRRVFLKGSFILFWILLFTYLIGFLVFMDFLPTYKPDEVQNFNDDIDAIVVLTGGSERIPEGLQMLNDKKAKLLFISGLYTKKSLEYYRQALSQFKNIQDDKIHFDTVAMTTIENAEQVHNWTRVHNIESMYLVTSYYHIPRSKYLIESYMPNVKVIPNPVFPVNYDKGKSLQSARIFSLIFFEYNKYILSNMMLWIGLI